MFEFIGVKYKEIIDIPSLEIPEHSVTTLVGTSGSGKTTILKMLNKMISPTDGHIEYEGVDLRQIDSVMHRRNVTMLAQSPAMFEGNIRDNLLIGLKFQKRQLPGDNKLVTMLESVRLNKPVGNPVGTLSGGEKQRLALARVLLLDSDVYLLDEPSSALDESTAEAIIEMFADFIHSNNKTLVMVTHQKTIAQKFSDHIIEVDFGKCTRRAL